MTYLTSRVCLPLNNGTAHIGLAELGSPDAAALIREAVKAHALVDESEVSEGEVEAIWERAGGNPLAIRQTAQMLYSAP